MLNLKIQKPSNLKYPGSPRKKSVYEIENFTQGALPYMKAPSPKKTSIRDQTSNTKADNMRDLRWSVSGPSPKRAQSALPKWSIPDPKPSIAETPREEHSSEREENSPPGYLENRAPPDAETERELLDQIMIRVDDPEYEGEHLETEENLMENGQQEEESGRQRVAASDFKATPYHTHPKWIGGTSRKRRADSEAKFVNPIPFLEELKGKQVVIKLKWGQEYRGNLQAFDGYFNFQLDNAEEWIDDECKGNLGEIVNDDKNKHK